MLQVASRSFGETRLYKFFSLYNFVEPSGGCNFQTARLCSPLLVVYGVNILVNKVLSMGNGKQEDGKWYEVMKSLSVSMIAASSSCQRLLLNCVPGVLEPGS